ncbi:MAG: hypothetical protein QOC96_252 [Acidobacteriota bacterium]|jgi:tetratricopeptide (TPR) repeat protein|nr:hypothetical protein [Acidobacteriota bacterium]
MLTKLSTRKADEGDVVELTEDLPKYGFYRGQRGIVISGFEGLEEAYDLEMEGLDGDFLGFAYSVKPTQFTNLTEKFLEEGLTLLFKGGFSDAEKKLKLAVELTPRVKGVILNSILKNFGNITTQGANIHFLRLLCRMFPDYDLAKNNLAIAYLNYAVEEAKTGDLASAQMHLLYAVGIDASAETVAKIQENLAGVLTVLGLQAHMSGRYEECVGLMRTACATYPSETTRHNLRLAHGHLARFYMKECKYKEAMAVFEAAEEMGLILPELLNDYAITLIFEGHLDEAAYTFERALELGPDNQILKENLDKVRKSQSSETLVTEEIKTDYIPIPTTERHYQLAA